MMKAEEIFSVVIGTAGHIDHGKSSLVQRLTGVDPDRLPEEKSRGLTIDLGFAPWRLANGLRVGIVDVPGHERLIKNMVAGATGIDMVLLIVAADDSVMPQTREHLTIMEILGLRHGVVVITKIDAVERDLVDLVREEVSETLEGSFLEGAPLVEVSSITGEGFDELEATLNREIARLKPREESGVFRMPVQRVFSPKGFGTVVTGIPISGSVGLGDTLEIVPLGARGRVRGIQAYKETTDRARAGHSTALNLSDVDYRSVHRGMVAAEPGYFQGATMLEARLRYLPDAHRPLLHQTPIRLHVGTAEALGKVYLLEQKKLEPGEESYVQFRLEDPVVTAPGDRYVLRLHSPMETIGGGEILGRSRWRLKTGKSYVLEQLRDKESALGDEKLLLLQRILDHGDVVAERDVPRVGGLTPERAAQLVSELLTEGSLRRSSRAGQLVASQKLMAAAEHAREIARDFFIANPRRSLLDKALLRQRLDCHDAFLQDLLAELERAGELHALSGGQLRWRDYGPRLTEADVALKDRVEEAVRGGRFAPPTAADLASSSGEPPERVTQLCDLLTEEGVLLKLGDGLYLHGEALEEGKRLLQEHLAQHVQMTAADAKNVLGSTRKYIIPLLEHLDREGFTLRKGDVRELRHVPSADPAD